MTISLDTGSPVERDPDDFERNSQGRPWVAHPDTGKRVLYERPSAWPFDDYSGIDPIFANRGTWVHTLTEGLDLDEPPIATAAETERSDW